MNGRGHPDGTRGGSQTLSYEEVFIWAYSRYAFLTGDVLGAASIAHVIARESVKRQARRGHRPAAAERDDRFAEVDRVNDSIHLEVEQYFGAWMNLYKDRQRSIDPETVWVRIVASLMHSTTGGNRKSPYTALAILKILCDFSYKEVADFYTLITAQGIDEDELRRKKKLLFNPLASRNGSFVQTDKMGNEGTRFINEPATDKHQQVARHLLNLVTFIRPTCCELPPFNPKVLDLHEFIKDHVGSDSSKDIERGRKHIMGHPKCFSEILTALNFADFFQRLWVMKVVVPDNGCGPSDPPINRNDPPPTPPDELLKEYKKKSLGSKRLWLRRSRKPFSDKIRVSYADQSKELALGNSRMAFGFSLNFGDNVIKVADVDDIVDGNPNVLMPLDMHFISWEAGEGVERTAEFVTELPTGARLTFVVEFGEEEDGLFTSANVQVAYTPAEAPATVRDARPVFGGSARNWLFPVALLTAFFGGLISGRAVGHKVRNFAAACLAALVLLPGSLGAYALYVLRSTLPSIASQPDNSLDTLLAKLPPSPDSAPWIDVYVSPAVTGSEGKVRAKRYVPIPEYIKERKLLGLNHRGGLPDGHDAAVVNIYSTSTLFPAPANSSASAVTPDELDERNALVASSRELATEAWLPREQSTQTGETFLQGAVEIPVTPLAAQKYALRERLMHRSGDYFMFSTDGPTLVTGVGGDVTLYTNSQVGAFGWWNYPAFSAYRPFRFNCEGTTTAPEVNRYVPPLVLGNRGDYALRNPCVSASDSVLQAQSLREPLRPYPPPAGAATPTAESNAARRDTGPSIFGSVVNPGGVGVARARVVAVGRATGKGSLVVSDAEGRFTFPSLPDDTYRLTVESAGFENVTIEEANVRAGSPLQLDFRLELIARATESATPASGSSAAELASSESAASGLGREGAVASSTSRPARTRAPLYPRSARRTARGFDGERVYGYSRPWSAYEESQPETLVYVLRKGQLIRLRAVDEVSSADAKAGDRFETTVVAYHGHSRAVPAGSLVTGRIEGARRAGPADGPGVLYVNFSSLHLPDGSSHKIEGRLTDAPKETAGGRAPEYLPDYDFKRKVVFRGGNARESGTTVAALTLTRSNTPRSLPNRGANTFTPSAAYEEATIRRDAEFWMILKKDVKIPVISR